MAQQPISERARKLHQEAILIDPCVQYLVKRSERSDRSGLTAAGLTIPMPGDDLVRALPRMQEFLEVIANEPAFCLAESVESIRIAKQRGQIAHLCLAQDSLMIGTDWKSLYLWKQLGLRICQLTYNERNLVGSGCLELSDDGLSQFGHVLIRKLEQIGITIDLTHVGPRTFLDACKVAKAPLITSHSNPKSVVNNPRNITDEQIRAVGDSGGVVCVTTWAPLIWPHVPRIPTLDDWLRCLEHTIRLIGIDHVGVSTDSVGTMGAYPIEPPDPDALPYNAVTGDFDRIAQPPDSNNRQPADFNGIEDFPWMVQKLIDVGYRDEEIRKLLGENLLRVFAATWHVYTNALH